MNYVLTNPEKERMAKEVVAKKGNVGGKPNPHNGFVGVAQVNLYNRALEENPKMSEEDLVLYVYRGLGGRVEEYSSPESAKERAEKLQKIRVRQNKRDAAL